MLLPVLSYEVAPFNNSQRTFHAPYIKDPFSIESFIAFVLDVTLCNDCLLIDPAPLIPDLL